MTDIKIKRCADKENLKKLMRYIKATFANKSEIDTKLTSKANTSDLATVATSGDYNDLINSPAIRVEDDGSLHVTRDTDGEFFRFTNTGWSTSGSNAWGGMYFETSEGRDVFGFGVRQSQVGLEKFSVGNSGYLRGYDTNGNKTVTLVINGGTAYQPDTQNIMVDGTFVNAGNQQPYNANMYTIGTSDMPYEAMYAGTFNTASPSGDSGLTASNPSTKHSLLFGIGSTGVNRGIYDNKNRHWSVFLDDTNYIMTQCPTPPKGDSSNKLATTEWVQTELADKADTSALDAKVDISALDSYATKDDLSASIPVGTVFHGMYSSIPTGFLALNGQTISKTTYSALYNVLKAVADANGTSLDDSETTFTLPTISYDNLTAIIKY